MHRLAGIEVEHVAHPVCQAQRVGSVLLEALVDQKLPGLSRAFEPAAELAAQARVLDLLGHLSAEVWGQDLPLDGQHAVALQVTEGAVVGDDLEAVAEGLQAAPGTKLGATARIASGIPSPQRRASGRGWARRCMISCSKVWPLAKMPTWESAAAGSRPRSTSRALARTARS